MTRARHIEVFVFAFDEAQAQYEGRLIGALERAESGGAVRVVEVLFVSRETGSGELTAIRLAAGRGGFVGRMAELRLDGARRRERTRQTLEEPGADVIRELAEAVQPGAAMAAILVEHPWVAALDEAVERSGGRRVLHEATAAGSLPDLAVQALSAAR
jgi:hypothetical protein